MLLEAHHLQMHHGERLLLSIADLQVTEWDRIGLVGINGAGKSTLLDILSGLQLPDAGQVRRFGEISHMRQFHEDEALLPHLSGGEKTRIRFRQAIRSDAPLLLADEPTANMDMDAIREVEHALLDWPGALVLVSHDRALMDAVCRTIWELENGVLNVYSGNWSDFVRQREEKRAREQFEYDSWRAERRRLQESISEIGRRAGGMRKAPARMGNSEARLHKRESTQIQGKLFRGMHALESRLERLEQKERPADLPEIRMDFSKTDPPTARHVVQFMDWRLEVPGPRVLAEHVTLDLVNGSRTAFVGGNGTGKTSLIRTMLDAQRAGGELRVGESRVRVTPKVRFGYFSQDLDVLDPGRTMLENVMTTSVQTESIARTVLARLMFRREEVHKRVSILSGGERVKVALARILLSDANVIVLDEPTNWLDVFAMESLQQLLAGYEGTLLLVSHDRRFIQSVADHLWVFSQTRIRSVSHNSADLHLFFT